jgi:hypothetical protein
VKKTSIIPLLVLLLLITAGVFRWDKETTQVFDKSLKVQILEDRWTGQTWVKLHGSLPENRFYSWSYAWLFADERNFWDRGRNQSWHNILRGINIKPDSTAYYTGETYPYFPTDTVNINAKSIQNSEAHMDKLNELKQRMEKADEDKLSHSKGHTEYIRLYESLKNDQDIAKDRYNKGLMKGLEKLVFEWGEPVINSSEVVRSLIPRDIAYEYDQWQKADKQIQKINYQISNIGYWDKSEAIKQLTNKANNIRLIATIVWIVLMVSSLVTLIIMFISSTKKADTSSNNSQIPI